MAQLRLLDDLLHDLVSIDPGTVGAVQTVPREMGDSSTIQQEDVCANPPPVSHEPVARDSVLLARSPDNVPTPLSGSVPPGRASLSSSMGD